MDTQIPTPDDDAEWDLWSRACGQKVRYPTRHAAKAEARRLKRVHHGKSYDVYRCRFCGFVHVGSRGIPGFSRDYITTHGLDPIRPPRPRSKPTEAYADLASCTVCGQGIEWVDGPSGGWWVHLNHPADEHDAVAEYDETA